MQIIVAMLVSNRTNYRDIEHSEKFCDAIVEFFNSVKLEDLFPIAATQLLVQKRL